MPQLPGCDPSRRDDGFDGGSKAGRWEDRIDVIDASEDGGSRPFYTCVTWKASGN